MTAINMVNEALRLAECGFKVFPIHAGKKFPPHITKWQELASNNPDQIEHWWGLHPEANIGILTTGLLVIDVDSIKTKDAEGKIISTKPNDWPGNAKVATELCPVALTANGGRHYLFKQPPGAGLRNTAGKLAPGVDTRANGGYVVAAPSIVDGKQYTWQPGYSPDDFELKEPPEWLMSELAKCGAKTRADGDSSSLELVKYTVPDVIAPGTRDNELTRLAGALRRYGLDEDEIYGALVPANIKRAGGQKSDSDLRRIAGSVQRYDSDQGAEMEILGVPINQEIARFFDGKDLNQALNSLINGLPDGPANRHHDLKSELKQSLKRLERGDDFQAVAKSLTTKITALTAGTAPQKLATLTSAELDSGSFPLEYLIPGVLVRGQPCILAGPKKSLKTNILIDLTLSLASGQKFLNVFPVSKPVRVALVSGESGQATIQETARRVARSKPTMSLASCSNALWCFDLPKLGQSDTVDVVSSYVRQHAIDVLILDPAYLCMPLGDSASNLFAVGSVLSDLTRISDATGVSIILCHHTKKKSQATNPYAEPELDDIAWAGFAEWARQWILLNRQQAYDPDNQGHHELWMSAGGSAGHSGVWSVEIDEGSQQSPGGRKWDVRINNPAVVRGQKANALKAKKEIQARIIQDANRKKLIDTYELISGGDTATGIRNAAKMNGAKFAEINAVLLREGLVEACDITKNNKRLDGFRLKIIRDPDNPDSPGQVSGCPSGPGGQGCESDNPSL